MTAPSPDVRLVIKAKNARLMRAIEAAGHATFADFVRSMGSKAAPSDRKYPHILALANFRLTPVTKYGEWRVVALDVAAALHVEPEELWPEALQQVEMKQNGVTVDLTLDEFAAVASSEATVLDRIEVQEMLAWLGPRPRRLLELRYGLNGNGEHGYSEIAEELGYTSTQGVIAFEKRVLAILCRKMGKPLPERLRPKLSPTQKRMAAERAPWRLHE